MEAISAIIDSERISSIIDLPISLRNRRVEVVVIARPEDAMESPEQMTVDRSALRNLKGCFKEYADPALRKLEEGAWERAAVEKHLKIMKDDRS